MAKKEFIFSKHYKEDKNIDVELAADCVSTGKKELDAEPNKFRAVKKYRRGELKVIFRDCGDYFFVVSTSWQLVAESSSKLDAHNRFLERAGG